jgi:Xaa-Pro aminopeptidase
MEYSPRNAIPYLSKVDAGTIELVRGCGVEVISSGDIVQEFEATLTPRQFELHREAERVTTSAYDKVWQFIREEVRTKGGTRETDVQRVIMEHFAAGGCVTDHPPIVGVGPHSGDPHYAPSPEREAWIREGDYVLVDLWAKRDHPDAIYSDLTRVAFVGKAVPPPIAEVFAIVAAARDAALDAIRAACAAKQPIQGCQVDRICRGVIEAAGHGPHFVHRTGHSLGRETHGNGANLDDLETRDERTLLPRTCFTIEPGIYLPEFGVRSEINVYLDAECQVYVTGGPVQREVLALDV